PIPVVIHLGLRRAVHDERERLGEVEVRTAVQRGEVLAGELEGDRHDRAFLAAGDSRALRAVAGDREDARVVEDRRVEVHRLLGLVVEPEERRDSLDALLHGWLPLVVFGWIRRDDERGRARSTRRAGYEERRRRSCTTIARTIGSSAPRPHPSP